MTPDDVVDDGAGLDDGMVAFGHHRGLAQGMDGGEFRRGQAGGGVPGVELDFVGQAQLFQQPQNALGPGVVEVVDDKHGGVSVWVAKGVSAGGRGGKVGSA